jgi:hypothetical protein
LVTLIESRRWRLERARPIRKMPPSLLGLEMEAWRPPVTESRTRVLAECADRWSGSRSTAEAPCRDAIEFTLGGAAFLRRKQMYGH